MWYGVGECEYWCRAQFMIDAHGCGLHAMCASLCFVLCFRNGMHVEDEWQDGYLLQDLKQRQVPSQSFMRFIF
jgi:hypothetical protein